MNRFFNAESPNKTLCTKVVLLVSFINSTSYKQKINKKLKTKSKVKDFSLNLLSQATSLMYIGAKSACYNIQGTWMKPSKHYVLALLKCP